MTIREILSQKFCVWFGENFQDSDLPVLFEHVKTCETCSKVLSELGALSPLLNMLFNKILEKKR